MTGDEPDRFQAHLASLDRKMGRTVTVEDWRRVGATAASHPEALSDDDLLVLAAFAGETHAKQTADRRAHALAPPARPSEPTPQPTHTERATVKMNQKSLEPLATTVVTAIKRAIDGPQVAGKIAALEQRLVALEAKPHVKFCGVYEAGKTFRVGDAATHRGSLWICRADDAGEPGTDFTGWTLAVKRGRDGRDAR